MHGCMNYISLCLLWKQNLIKVHVKQNKHRSGAHQTQKKKICLHCLAGNNPTSGPVPNQTCWKLSNAAKQYKKTKQTKRLVEANQMQNTNMVCTGKMFKVAELQTSIAQGKWVSAYLRSEQYQTAQVDTELLLQCGRCQTVSPKSQIILCCFEENNIKMCKLKRLVAET